MPQQSQSSGVSSVLASFPTVKDPKAQGEAAGSRLIRPKKSQVTSTDSLLNSKTSLLPCRKKAPQCRRAVNLHSCLEEGNGREEEKDFAV